MSAIYRKEMKVYFGSMFAYFIMAILLFFMGLFVALYNLMSGSGEFSYALASMEWVLAVTVPFLTMRAIAEERHTRTDRLLYSLPIPLRSVVLGKYFALVSLFLIPTLISAVYPLLLSTMGNISLPAAYTALLGYALMGCTLIAICLFVSSLVENQIIAAVISVLAVLVFGFIGTVASMIPQSALLSFILCLAAAFAVAVLAWRTAKNLTLGLIVAALLVLPISLVYIFNSDLFISLVPNFLNALDPFARFNGFSYGHLDIPSLIFYLTVIGFFLFLTVQIMEKRRRA